MRIISWIIILVFAFWGCSSSQKLADYTPVLTTYTFDEIESRVQDEAKPIAIFLYTSWCSFCKNMEVNTLTDPEVISLLNDSFYYIPFDGEYPGNVNLRGNVYSFKPTGRNTGTHELAQAIGSVDGLLSYPTWILMNPTFELIFQHNAFMSASDLKEVLRSAIQ